MTFWEMIFEVIKILAIFFGVLITSIGIISKIGEESRKNADHGDKLMEKWFKKIPEIMTDTFKEITKFEKEQEEAQNEKMRKMYEIEDKPDKKKMSMKEDPDWNIL